MTDYKDDSIWLMKGDCLERMKEIESGSVDMILADPPYGTTQCKWDSVIPLEPMWEQLKRIIKPNGAIVMTAAQPFTSVLVCSNMKMFKYCWIWDKSIGTGFLNANKQPMRSHEDVVVFYSRQCAYNKQMRDGASYSSTFSDKNLSSNLYGGAKRRQETRTYIGRNPVSIVSFMRDKGRIHPTQKPVALMEYLIKTYTNEGETVLDFTIGSGTTGVAAVNLGRKFIGIEMDDHYFEVAKGRILGERNG